jgi:hypothetical protein
MTTIEEKDSVGMTAAMVVFERVKQRRFGRLNGFAACDHSAEALRSDYVRLMTKDLNVTVHLDEVISFGSHSPKYWAWIEK